MKTRRPDNTSTHGSVAPPFTTGAPASVEHAQSDRIRASRLTATCAADVAPTQVEWLWNAWLPFGKIVSFDGAPGIGKSTVVTDLIARASRGGPMPYEDSRFTPITTMIAGVEDGWSDTVRPRLDAANADLSRVHFLMANAGASLTIPHDVKAIGEKALDLGARWLHLDSIMGTLDEKTDANSDHQVRRALGPLKELAESRGLMVTFIRHPRKAGGLAVNAGGDSIAFSALSRVGLFCGLDPQDETEDQNARRRILTVSKSNLGRLPRSLAFTLIPSVGGVSISWQGPSSVSADDLAAPFTPPSRATERPHTEPRRRERDFLRELLANGPVAVDDVKAAARARGLSWRSVERAASDEGVSKERAKSFRGGGTWYLARGDEHGGDAAPTDSPPFPPFPPPPRTYAKHGGSGGNGAIGGATASVGRVLVTLYSGEVMELDADDRDLTDLRDFITNVEPVNAPPTRRATGHAGPGLERTPFPEAA